MYAYVTTDFVLLWDETSWFCSALHFEQYIFNFNILYQFIDTTSSGDWGNRFGVVKREKLHASAVLFVMGNVLLSYNINAYICHNRFRVVIR